MIGMDTTHDLEGPVAKVPASQTAKALTRISFVLGLVMPALIGGSVSFLYLYLSGQPLQAVSGNNNLGAL